MARIPHQPTKLRESRADKRISDVTADLDRLFAKLAETWSREFPNPSASVLSIADHEQAAGRLLQTD
jgi:hypothetical protein